MRERKQEPELAVVRVRKTGPVKEGIRKNVEKDLFLQVLMHHYLYK